jgi:hypothetical protein
MGGGGMGGSRLPCGYCIVPLFRRRRRGCGQRARAAGGKAVTGGQFDQGEHAVVLRSSGFEDGVPLFGRVVVAQVFQPNAVYFAMSPRRDRSTKRSHPFGMRIVSLD